MKENRASFSRNETDVCCRQDVTARGGHKSRQDPAGRKQPLAALQNAMPGRNRYSRDADRR
jgi:hypothetical protein